MQGAKAESRQRKKYSSKVQMPTLIFKRRLPAVQIQQELSVSVNGSSRVHAGDCMGRKSGGINGGFMGRSEAPPAAMEGSLMLYITEMRNLERKKKAETWRKQPVRQIEPTNPLVAGSHVRQGGRGESAPQHSANCDSLFFLLLSFAGCLSAGAASAFACL